MNPALEAIAAAISGAGGPAKVAEALSVSVQAVCFWRDGSRRFPAEYCPTLERLNGGRIKCEQMRPDADWAYLRNQPSRNRPKRPRPTTAEQGV